MNPRPLLAVRPHHAARPSETPRPTLSRLELRCPPLPQTLMEAMALVDDPERLDVETVTAMVQRDPAVVARLLHVVNSAYYGLRHPISSTERAVVLLGPAAVASIIVGMNVLKMRAAVTDQGTRCFADLSRHCLATAFLTRHLVEGAPRHQARARTGPSFTAGLLHDFGKLILLYNFPDEAVRFFGEGALQQQVQGCDRREVEQLLFGYDHAEAGSFVARKMRFPDVLTATIQHHHAPTAAIAQRAPEAAPLILAVQAADRAAKALGYGFACDLSWEACAADPVWETLHAQAPGRAASAEALLDEVLGQGDHLSAYVEGMMAPPPSPAPDRSHLRLLPS